MGRIPETVKIGAFVVLAVLGIWGSVALINGGFKGRANTYGLIVRFKDATGVTKGMDVTAAGSPIGFVEGTPGFDKDQRLTIAHVRIDKGVTVYKKSRFIIAQNGLLGEKMLTLEDPLPQDRIELAQEGDVFDGETQGDLQTIVARADDLLDEVHDLIGPNGVGGSLRELSSTLNTSMGKVNGITDQVDKLLSENSGYMTASMKNFQAMSGNMVRLSANLQDASLGVKQLTTDPANHEQLKAIMANLDQASANMTTLTNQLNGLIGDPELQQNAKDTLRLSKETLEETKKTVEQFQGTLSGMDSTFEKVGSLVNTADTTLGRVSRKLGVKGQPAAPAKTGKDAVKPPPAGAAKPSPTATAAGCGKGGDTLQLRLTADVRGVDQNRSGRVDRGDRGVADLNAAVGFKGKYLQAGVDNIGDGGDINLLAGVGSLKGGSARAGVYRGQFGAGLAWYTQGFGAELTGYDPRDPKLDATGYVSVGDSVDIILGVQDATNTKKVTAGVGVKF